jgi:hypothetical protein
MQLVSYLVSYIADSLQHRMAAEISAVDGESEIRRFLFTRIFDNVIRLPDLKLDNIIS